MFFFSNVIDSGISFSSRTDAMFEEDDDDDDDEDGFLPGYDM